MKRGTRLAVFFTPLDLFDENYEEEDAQRIFDALAAKLVTNFIARRSPTSVPEAIPPIPWLESVCYEWIQQIVEADHIHVFEARIAKYKRGRRGLSTSNLFQRAILAIFAADPSALNHRQRERIGKRLWHAYRHYVPLPFLAGFLGRGNNAELVKRASKNLIDEEFYDWVKEQHIRSKDQNSQRGKYPAKIEDAAKKAWAKKLV